VRVRIRGAARPGDPYDNRSAAGPVRAPEKRCARVSADTRATAVARPTPVPTGLPPAVRPGPLFRA